MVGQETATPAGATSPSNNTGATWTNQVNGKADLGAQTVEFDIWEQAFNAPVSPATVRIWGPTKAQISQASDFNGAPISIYGGMQVGLPLATAATQAGQAGLLLSGQIFQAFGNWQGLTQTLDFVVTADGGATQSNPANISFLWLAGQPMSQVLQQTLQIAYPNFTVSVNVSSALVLTQNEAGVYQTLQQFAAYVNGVSQDIIGGDYQGVIITLKDNTINVFDNSVSLAANPVKQILYQDLIGQVTWLSAYTISFSTVMRGDMSVGTVVQLPQLAGLQAVSSAASQTNARAQAAFSGTWTVSSVRHVGNSRAPDAESWISNFQAFSNTAAPAALSVGDSSA